MTTLVATPTPGLARAELLKLRRRRGLVAAAATLTIAPVAIVYLVLRILHAVNPGKYGPAGGEANFVESLDVLRTLGVVATIIVGVTAAASDVRAGVFRELVVTGRSRLALFAARIPGGLALLLPLAAVAFAVTATASFAFAGTLATPDGGLLLHAAAWTALVVVTSYALAVGLGSLVGSTGPSIGILITWTLIVAPQLFMFEALGVVRELLPAAGALVLAPAGYEGAGANLPMSTAAAVANVVAWAVVPLVAGAWRTLRRDA